MNFFTEVLGLIVIFVLIFGARDLFMVALKRSRANRYQPRHKLGSTRSLPDREDILE